MDSTRIVICLLVQSQHLVRNLIELCVLQEYRNTRVRASSLQLDHSFRMRDELEMSIPQKKNPVTTLLNVAMIAAAAGIATALCRELQVGLI